MRFALGRLEAAVEARLAGLQADRLPERLWGRDPTLWSADSARQTAIGDRLGWLSSPAAMAGQVAALRAFHSEVAAQGFTRALLLGMGGSSLAPEVLRLTLGVEPGGLELSILDDTSPEAVAAAEAAHNPRRTLFIVSSKSGSTIEVVSFERYFHARATRARGDEAGRGFVAITDPGTPLARLARERGYRRLFPGLPDVGGRYSALSPFGLVPAALIGADLDSLVGGAQVELDTLRAGGPARGIPGVRLGAALGELALHGRDKLTLVIEPRLAALGAWVEQLVAESTGKDGRGIVPVVDEPPTPPERYGDDRLFVVLGAGTSRLAAALEAAGRPVIAWDPARHGLGAEFARWEIATATAAAILGINPFDEPDVAEAKRATAAALEGFLAAGRFPAGRPLATGDGLEAHAPGEVAARAGLPPAGPRAPAAWLPALLELGRPGDYVALLAYLRRTPGRHRRLQRLRGLLGAGGLATTLGYGPRYLHSTGQLHKGGPGSGLFVMLTAEAREERSIPGERYGFASLHRAQAEGDEAALVRGGRRLLRLHLGADVEAGLDALIAALAATGRL